MTGAGRWGGGSSDHLSTMARQGQGRTPVLDRSGVEHVLWGARPAGAETARGVAPHSTVDAAPPAQRRGGRVNEMAVRGAWGGWGGWGGGGAKRRAGDGGLPPPLPPPHSRGGRPGCPPGVPLATGGLGGGGGRTLGGPGSSSPSGGSGRRGHNPEGHRRPRPSATGMTLGLGPPPTPPATDPRGSRQSALPKPLVGWRGMARPSTWPATNHPLARHPHPLPVRLSRSAPARASRGFFFFNNQKVLPLHPRRAPPSGAPSCFTHVDPHAWYRARWWPADAAHSTTGGGPSLGMGVCTHQLLSRSGRTGCNRRVRPLPSGQARRHHRADPSS